jgi:D-glycero-D-manno-heptose 1,7-bisphosphate phosphatase
MNFVKTVGDNPAVWLDRDGVLVRAIERSGKPFSASMVSEMTLMGGAREACSILKEAGFKLLVVSNQPEVSRGTLKLSVLQEMNLWLLNQLPLIDGIYICTHDSEDDCKCRKPRPGLLIYSGSDHYVDLAKSYIVGDRWKDISAGIAVGCRTIFIDHNYDEIRPLSYDFACRSLLEAVAWIVRDRDKGGQ